MKGHRDLQLIVAAATLCALGSLITPLGELRAVLAVPLTLFLPGYAITAAVAGRHLLGWPELVPLGLGLSLAALALGSIVLNFTPGGIQGLPWVLLLLLVVIGCCRIAAQRRKPPKVRRPTAAPPRPTPAAALLLAASLTMAAAALAIAQTTPQADRAFGYTTLWMTPIDRSGDVVRIGVSSEQQEITVYRLEVKLGNRRALVRSFGLAPSQTRLFELEPSPSDQATRVEATLFKRGRPDDPYRRVFNWLPPAQGGSS